MGGRLMARVGIATGSSRPAGRGPSSSREPRLSRSTHSGGNLMNAKKALASIVVTLGITAVGTAWAQTPPAGSTGECKDNTYTSSASKRGACKGHGGVKEWYATEKESKSAKSSSS